MKAVKANKEYRITEQEKARYQKEGFDILGDDGKVIAYGKGKTVPYEQYMEVKEELEAEKAKEKEKETEEPSGKRGFGKREPEGKEEPKGEAREGA